MYIDDRGQGGLLNLTGNSYLQNWRSKMPVAHQILLDFMHLFSGMFPSFQGILEILQYVKRLALRYRVLFFYSYPVLQAVLYYFG